MVFTRTFCWVFVTVGMMLAGAGPAGSADVEAPPEGEEELVMGFVQQHAPDGVSILNPLREDDPEAFRIELRLLHNQILELQQIRRQSPEIAEMMVSRFRLELFSRALARKIVSKPARDDAGELEDQLRSMLEELFELRLRLTEAELAQLEQDVIRLREAIQRRRDSKEARIDEQLQSILERGLAR